jgi:hypothetical protein
MQFFTDSLTNELKPIVFAYVSDSARAERSGRFISGTAGLNKAPFEKQFNGFLECMMKKSS